MLKSFVSNLFGGIIIFLFKPSKNRYIFMGIMVIIAAFCGWYYYSLTKMLIPLVIGFTIVGWEHKSNMQNKSSKNHDAEVLNNSELPVIRQNNDITYHQPQPQQKLERVTTTTTTTVREIIYLDAEAMASIMERRS